MFLSEKSYSGLVLLEYRDSKDSVLPADWMVFATLESYPMDGWTDTRIETLGKQCFATNVTYQRRILLGYLLIILKPNNILISLNLVGRKKM